MNGNSHTFPTVLFAAALLAFLLPFATVRCQGGGSMRLTGVQLTVGDSLEELNSRSGPGGSEKMLPSSPALGSAALCAVAGLGFAGTRLLRRTPSDSGANLLFGGAGAVLLLWFMLRFNGEIREKNRKVGGPLLVVDYNIGYWVALLGMGGAAAFGIRDITKKRLAAADTSPAETASDTTPGANS